MKTVMKIALGVVLAFVLLIGGCMALIGGAANEIDKSIKEDTAAAMSDVKLTDCGGYDVLDGPKAKVQIKNSGDAVQDYYVEVTFYDKDENTLGTGNASIENLKPGKTWKGDVTSLDQVKPHVDFTCKVTDVTAVDL